MSEDMTKILSERMSDERMSKDMPEIIMSNNVRSYTGKNAKICQHVFEMSWWGSLEEK